MHTRVFILIGVLLASPAAAQRLDLGPPTPPPTDNQPALASLVRELEREVALEIRRLTPRVDDEAVPPPPDPDALDPTLSLELRRLALALAERAARATGPGAALDALGARTLTRHMVALSAVEHAEAAAAVRVLARTPPPPGPPFDRALRDALAPLTDRCGPPPIAAGWSLRADTPRTREPISARAPALAHTADATARSLTAAGVPHHLRPAARALAHRADRALDLYRPLPAWVDRSIAETHANEVLTALTDVALHDPRAHERLDRLIDAAAAVRTLDALPPSRATTDARSVAQRLIRSGDATALRDASRLARALAAGDPPAERTDLIRQLRPAWPRLLDQRRRAHARLVALLPRALTLERPITQPAFLAMLADTERIDRDIALLARVSAVLAGGVVPEPPRRPEPAERYEDTADRLLGLVRALPDRRDADTPFTPSAPESALRAFARDVDRFIPLPHQRPPEQTMRDDLAAGGARAAAWNRMTAGEPRAFLDELASRRERWLTTWAPGERATDALWLAQAHGFLDIAADTAALAGARDALRRGAGTPATAWPGWELSADAADALLRPCEAALQSVARALAAGTPSIAQAGLESVRTNHAAALVAGRIERIAVSHPPGGSSPVCGALHELALGPPDPRYAVLAPARADLAELARWAEETGRTRGTPRATARSLANDAARRAMLRMRSP